MSSNSNWENVKEKGAEVADNISDTAQRMKPESEKSLVQKASEKVSDWKEDVKESGANVGDNISDTAQRMKPEDQKSLFEKTRETVADTWEATKENAQDLGYKLGLTSQPGHTSERVKETGSNVADTISDTAQRMKPESEKSLFEKTRERAEDRWEATKENAQDLNYKLGLTSQPGHTSERVKETGSNVADNISDTAQRMKPEDQKSLFEKTRERAEVRWETTKENAQDLSYKLGLTSQPGHTSEYLKETGSNVGDNISDTAQRMKPEDQKSLFEKTRETVADTWEATKENAQDLGYKLGLTSQPGHTSEHLKETGSNVADTISDTAQRMKPESEKSFGQKTRERAEDTWESTKEKAREVGDNIEKPRE